MVGFEPLCVKLSVLFLGEEKKFPGLIIDTPCCSLFFVFRIDEDGDWSVVDEFHLHVCSEFPCWDRALQGF